MLYEVSITLIPKPDQVTTRKENYRPISLIKLDTEALNQLLVNQIQEHSKNIIHNEREMSGWCNIYKSISMMHHINRRNKKNPMIISIGFLIF